MRCFFHLTVISFLALSSTAFGQSAKKINKQLKFELAEAKATHDSIDIVYKKSTELWEYYRDQLRLWGNPIGVQLQIIIPNIREASRLYGTLKLLGEDTTTLPDLSELRTWSPPQFDASIVKAVQYETNYMSAPSAAISEELPLMEQNEKLKVLLEEYSTVQQLNLRGIKKMQEDALTLKNVVTQPDTLTEQLIQFNARIVEAKALLEIRYNQLKADYQKGRVKKGYEKEYDIVFKPIEPTTPVEHDAFLIPPPSPKQEIIEVGQQAEFPGGMGAMRKYISDNLKLPKAVTSKQVSGKCYMQFTITATGAISDAIVVRGVPDCTECDEEALRLVKGMPDWTPASMNGKPVSTKFNLPIKFESK